MITHIDSFDYAKKSLRIGQGHEQENGNGVIEIMMKRSVLFILFIIALTGSLTTPIHAQTSQELIDEAIADLVLGREYMADFPGLKTRLTLRQDYLEVDEDGIPNESTPRFDLLQDAYNKSIQARSLNFTALSEYQKIQSRTVAWEALEALLQGQLMSGNANFLKGLRVAWPDEAGGGMKPGGETILPVGFPGDAPGIEYSGVKITDLCYADLHFLRGMSGLLDFMATDPEGKIRAVDRAHYETFPQYTIFDQINTNPGQECPSCIPDPNFTGDRSMQTSGYLMGNLLDRFGKVNVAIADRLWRAAYYGEDRDEAEKKELLEAAMTGLQKGIHGQFLAALPLAATVDDGELYGDEDDYQECLMDQVKVTCANAATMIDRIRRGEKPKLDTIELNTTMPVLNQFIADINAQKSTVYSKWNAAKTALWRTYEQEQQVANEMIALRTQYSGSLWDYTYLDPEGDCPYGHGESYGGLETADQRTHYRYDVFFKINEMLELGMECTYLTEGSELGKTLLQWHRALADLASAEFRVQAIPEQVRIEEWRVGAVNGVILDATEDITAYNLAMGIANATQITHNSSASCGVTVGPPLFGGQWSAGAGCTIQGGISKSYNRGAITSADFQNKITRRQAIQQVDINNIESEARIRGLLLQMDQYDLEREAAAIQAQLAWANVNGVINKIDRLLQDHIYFQDAQASLWWKDPAILFEQEQEEVEYENELRIYKHNLYKLAKLLAYRWAEDYSNPTWNQNGGLLPFTDYADYTQIESIFNTYDHCEAHEYAQALREWDQGLRQHRPGDYGTTNVISLRRDIYGYSEIVWNPTYSRFEIDSTQIDPMVNRFRALMLNNEEPVSSGYWLRLEFPIVYNQKSKSYVGSGTIPSVITTEITPGESTSTYNWNARITSIKARLIGENIAQTPTGYFPVYLCQYGKIEIRTYVYPGMIPDDVLYNTYALPHYYYDPQEVASSWYKWQLDAGVDPNDGVPKDLGYLKPTPFCDKYVLLIPRTYNLNLQNLEDIELSITWQEGMPGKQPSDPDYLAWPSDWMSEPGECGGTY